MITRYQAAASRIHFEKRGIYETEYQNADEAEWAAARKGTAHIAQGTRDEMMSDAAVERGELPLPGDDYMNREAVEEDLQASVLEVINERQHLLGEAGYPFKLEENSLVFCGDESHPYLALLTLCQLPSVSSNSFKAAPVAFEYLSLIAARALLGMRSKGWRFGWPRNNQGQVKVADAVNALHRRAGNHMDEWHWQPAPSKPNNPGTRDLKDAGMDFVAWVPWHDSGPGQLHLLGQCACGEDWIFKKHDLNLNKLAEWMRLPHPHPVRALFTPRHLALPTLRDAASEAGLVLDRIRITQAIMNCTQAMRRSQRFTRCIVTIGKQV
ncbi:MAG: hypothetical protein ORN28_06180 [Rhodoferax sp.]|nr:hypothetical protein [Rhodoferax sp.]